MAFVLQANLHFSKCHHLVGIVRARSLANANLVQYSFNNVGTLLTRMDTWPDAILMYSDDGTLRIEYDFVASYTIVCTLLLTNVYCVTHSIFTQKLRMSHIPYADTIFGAECDRHTCPSEVAFFLFASQGVQLHTCGLARPVNAVACILPIIVLISRRAQTVSSDTSIKFESVAIQ